MNKLAKKVNIVSKFKGYLEKNREEINRTLVSLRFLKEIDIFLYNNKITQKEFAEKLKVSEPYISQLMTGSKKINVNFINNFEKTFSLEFKLTLLNKESEYTVIEIVSNDEIQLNTNSLSFFSPEDYCIRNKTNDVFSIMIENY